MLKFIAVKTSWILLLLPNHDILNSKTNIFLTVITQAYVFILERLGKNKYQNKKNFIVVTSRH